jgi:carbamate kinase
LNYKDKEKREKIGMIKVQQMRQYINEGHFSEGDMLPKIEACISFVEKTGKKAIITDIKNAEHIFQEHNPCGTIIIPDH